MHYKIIIMYYSYVNNTLIVGKQCQGVASNYDVRVVIIDIVLWIIMNVWTVIWLKALYILLIIYLLITLFMKRIALHLNRFWSEAKLHFVALVFCAMTIKLNLNLNQWHNMTYYLYICNALSTWWVQKFLVNIFFQSYICIQLHCKRPKLI